MTNPDLDAAVVMATLKKLGLDLSWLAREAGLAEDYLRRLLAGQDFSRRASNRVAEALGQEEARRSRGGADKI